MAWALSAPIRNSRDVSAGSASSSAKRVWMGRSSSTTASAVSALSGPYIE